VSGDFTETAINLRWTAPAPAEPGAPAIAFSVYEAGKADTAPLTPAPVAEPAFSRTGITFGTEQCFQVRSVVRLAGVSIESEPSAPACITPVDRFAPSPPGDLQAVSSPGVVALIWNASPEADVAGYVVLRGDAAGGTLQPLTPAPIRETVYRDTAVQSGVRYVYAVVAVDRATPPNTSAHSARVEVTASQ
jgi:hypothetical protein